VTEADILAGTVLNVATAKGTSPDPDEPEVPVEPGEDPEPTEEKNGHLTIEKVSTSTPANGTAYAAGETITYQITVENDGNLTITDIEVTDALTDETWTIESLAPEATEVFNTRYVVTAADAAAGSVVNVATATGTSPDPDEPEVPVEPGTDPEPTQPTPPVAAPVTLTVIYWANGAEVNRFTANYAPGSAYNVATPALAGYAADTNRVTGIITQNTTLNVFYTRQTYTLTINYVYTGGGIAAPSTTMTLGMGDAYDVVSPVINGYRASAERVTGNMAARNVTLTVFYTVDAAPAAFVPSDDLIVIGEYGVPLGLGNVSLNAGDSIE